MVLRFVAFLESGFKGLTPVRFLIESCSSGTVLIFGYGLQVLVGFTRDFRV